MRNMGGMGTMRCPLKPLATRRTKPKIEMPLPDPYFYVWKG
jgi:hypothetical protein